MGLRLVLTKVACGCAAASTMLCVACEEDSPPQRLPAPELPERDAIPNAEPSQATTLSPNAATPPDVSGPAFEEFVGLQRRIGQLQQALSLKISKGADPHQAGEEFEQQVKSIVQNSSMPPDVYHRYAKMMTSDPAFAERVRSLVQQKPAAGPGRGDAPGEPGESPSPVETGNAPKPTEAVR